MSTLTRNILSNVVERLISMGLTLVILPFQVRLLGIEAYGILGFVASLQVVFNILDLGLGPTVIREVASDGVTRRPQYALMLQTLACVYWVIAVITGLGLVGSADWISTHWLHVEALPVPTVVLAIRLIALTIFLRWPVPLYAGALTGSQRLDLVNGIRIMASMLKLVGGLAVLVYSRGLVPYLSWLTVAGFVETTTYMVAAARIVPAFSLRPRFSIASLSGVWRYSLHMNVISILAVVFVQVDRMVISYLLPIAELGFYSIAYSAVTSSSVIQNVMTAALFPALAHQAAQGQWSEIHERCRTAVQLLMYALCGLTCVLIFYGRDLLTVWISADAAIRSAPPLRILAVGFLFSAAVSVPYTLLIAAGHTRMPLALNLAAAVVYVPSMYWTVHTWGINGAAWAWVGLGTYYLFVFVPLTEPSLPMKPLFGWVLRNLFVFGVLAGLTIGGSFLVYTTLAGRRWPLVAAMAGSGAYIAMAYFALGTALRHRLINWWPQEPTWKVPAV